MICLDKSNHYMDWYVNYSAIPIISEDEAIEIAKRNWKKNTHETT